MTLTIEKRGRVGYFGGKAGAGVVQTLVNHVPPHEVLLIPFAGHCALTRSIVACRKTVLCDLDARVKSWWKTRLPAHATFIAQDGLVMLEHIAGNCGEVLEAAPDRVCIYCDPPYMLSTRTSAHRYRHDWQDADHSRFLQVVTRLSATGYRVMISHYANPLYDAALSDWSLARYTAQTRGGPRTETLYYNFKVTDLHDFRYFCGDSSKQKLPSKRREMMNRREQSARRKVLKMSPMERKRFLRSLVAEFGDGSSTPNE